MIMKPVIFVLLVCFGVSSGLNINFGLNKMFDVFGYTSNDIADIMEDEEVPDNRGDTHLPPPHDQVARMARYITHNSDWAALATIATRDPIIGFPFANVLSISDGPVDNSTGVPYIYISPWEISARDLSHNNKASLTMSLAQSGYCEKMNFDPEDPRCAHVILTGEFIKLDPESEEETFARNALFTRHPIMPDWPAGHHWFFAKIDIQNILILDWFGGAVTRSQSKSTLRPSLNYCLLSKATILVFL